MVFTAYIFYYPFFPFGAFHDLTLLCFGLVFTVLFFQYATQRYACVNIINHSIIYLLSPIFINIYFLLLLLFHYSTIWSSLFTCWFHSNVHYFLHSSWLGLCFYMGVSILCNEPWWMTIWVPLKGDGGAVNIMIRHFWKCRHMLYAGPYISGDLAVLE